MLVKRVIDRYLVVDYLFGAIPLAIDLRLLRKTFAEICKIEGKVFMKKSLVRKSGLLGIFRGVERFSMFAATGFNASLGIHLFCVNPDNKSIKN